jgi:EpsD family peptidyl-prolyl cis-trans isomerase
MPFAPNYKLKIYRGLGFVALALSLAACSGRHNSRETTQVAAKVGNYEITEFQVDNAIARVPNIPIDEVKAARLAALESLVKEQLIVQAAESQKLDRQPQVIAAIDKSRRDVISRAYVAQITQSQTKPSAEDVHQYFLQHPELFSARRIYSMKELTTPFTAETSAYLRGFAESGKTLEQLGLWLQQQKIPYRADTGSRTPESLPLSFLPQLATTKDGGVVVFNTASVFYVAQILSSRPAPVTEDKANQNIERFLTAQRSRAAIDREIDRLQATTKIEYEGEFSNATAKLTTNEEPLMPLSDQNQSSGTSGASSSAN